MVKLALHDGLGASLRVPQPMFAIAIVMALALVLGFASDCRAAVLAAAGAFAA
jgi:hypothetical protein